MIPQGIPMGVPRGAMPPGVPFNKPPIKKTPILVPQELPKPVVSGISEAIIYANMMITA